MSRGARDRIVARLRRLVADAEREGLALVADVDAASGGVRVMTAEEAGADDLRTVGVYVPLHNECGGAGSDKTGGGKWM